MAATRNNLRAATAALSAAAIILLAVILLAIRPAPAFAEGEQAQEACADTIKLTVPVNALPCAVKADGTVITPDPDCYAIKNEGSIAVVIAAPTVKLSEGAGTVSLSAQAAVIDTVDNNLFKDKFNSIDTAKFSWIEGNEGQSEQTLEPNHSLCAKFSIAQLTRKNNAYALDHAATSEGFNLGTISFSYKPKFESAFAVVYHKDGKKVAMLCKGVPVPNPGDSFDNGMVDNVIENIEKANAQDLFAETDNEKDRLTSVGVACEGIQPETMKGWFKGCSDLVNVDLSKLDTSRVTDMSWLFSDCHNLTSSGISSISGWSTLSVEDMSSMFYSCWMLTSLDLSKWCTENVKNMSWMFSSCYKLTSSGITSISKWNTQSVEDMSDMFSGDVELTSLDLSGWISTKNVKNMSYMFIGCSGLTMLHLSSFDASNVTDVSCMFTDCSGLEEVTLKQGWRFEFEACGLPKVLYVKNGDTYSEYNSVFPIAATTTFYTEGGPGAFAVIYHKDGKKAAMLCKGIPMPQSGESFQGGTVDYIIQNIENKSGLFKETSDTVDKLTFVAVLSEGIQPLTMESWFYGCRDLNSLDLRKLDTSKVKNMHCTFCGCTGLASPNLASFDTSNVTDMANMFYGCTGLASLNLASFDTIAVTNATDMFRDCALTSVTLVGSRWSSCCIAELEQFQLAYNGKQLKRGSVEDLSQALTFTKRHQRSLPNQEKEDFNKVDSKANESSGVAVSADSNAVISFEVSPGTEEVSVISEANCPSKSSVSTSEAPCF